MSFLGFRLRKKDAMSRKGYGVFCILFLFACLVSPSWGGEKEDTGTAFKLTLKGLEAVGGFPPPPVWAPYYSPWWGWVWPGWGAPMPYPPASYFPAPAPYPSSPYQLPPSTSSPNYPPQIKPAGRLLILSNPIDAEVYVDGVRLQQQPNLSYDVGLLAGPHQVDIRKDGFKPFSYKADIPPGGGMVLPVELEKQ